MADASEEEFLFGDKFSQITRFSLPWVLVNLFGGVAIG
jgi:hypothetical protein